MNRISFSLALVILSLIGAGASATPQISFDIDGPTGSAPSRQLTPNGLLDWLEGNAVVTGAKPIHQGVLPPIGTEFQMYYQAQMQSTTFASGASDSPFYHPPQEITLQTAIPMSFAGTTPSGSIALLDLGTDPTKQNFLRIYWDPTKDSNIFTGNGFGGGGDSILILDATFSLLNAELPIGATGKFAAEFLAIADVNFFDTGFFTVPLGAQIILTLDLDGLVKIPPQIPNSQNIVGYVPGAQDLKMSLDSTIVLNPQEIPVPASGLLLGIGLTSMAVFQWRRQRFPLARA